MQKPSPLPWLWLLGLVLLPVVTAIGFHLYTGEIWEDFFITFRFTENWVQGNGLVYQPGERVHGFTSVLNTLLPALPLLISKRLDVALGFYQACNLAVMAGGTALLFRALRAKYGSSVWELAVISVLVATSIKIVAFSTNGQEAGLLVGFWAMALAAVLRLGEGRQWALLGVSWTGLLYTRPDSPLYMVILAAISLVISVERRADAVRLARALAVSVGLYLPWLLIAWWYYGSPVPHTIIAKSSGSVLVGGSVLTTIQKVWSQWLILSADVFGPVYQPSDWPPSLLLGLTGFGVAVALYWLWGGADRFGRACSGGICVLLLYLAWVDAQRTAFPWYFPPVCLLGAITVARMASRWWASDVAAKRWAGISGVAILVVLCGVCLTASFRLFRIQQKEVEEGTRMKLGLVLKKNAQPGDSVYVECLGYIGYYYGGKMLDYPGLVSPEVVKVLRQPGQTYERAVEQLRPTWIVARLSEARAIMEVPANREAYEVTALMDNRKQLEPYGDFPGKAFLYHDLAFYVIHRKGSPMKEAVFTP